MMPNPPCHGCNAACCRDSGAWPFAVRLFPEDLKNPKLNKAKSRWVFPHRRWRNPDHLPLKEWVLKFVNGACPFLDVVENRCKIYDERPKICREFDCRQCTPFGVFLNANPNVWALLQQTENQTHEDTIKTP